MTRTQYYTAASLDGYIADGENSLGHENVLDDPEKWHIYYGATPCWVFTHRTLPIIPGVDLSVGKG